MKRRMSSFVDRGNKLIAVGKTDEAIKLIEKGLGYYSQNILNAIQPYSSNDAGLILIVLRNFVEQMENSNENAKEFADKMEKIIDKPVLQETTKVQKPNRK